MTVAEMTRVEVGGVWEDQTWEVHRNIVASGWRLDFENGDEYHGFTNAPCPHATNVYQSDPKKYRETFNDGSANGVKKMVVQTDVHWTVPRVVVATNEAGHNTTGVCLDCIVEWAHTND